MAEHPRRKTRRRIRDGITDRLGAGAHHRGVGSISHLGCCTEHVEGLALLLGEARRCGLTPGQGRRHFGRYDGWQVDVNAQQPGGCQACHRAGDGGAPVAALSDVASVTEALHQLRPAAGDAVRSPTGFRRLSGKPVAGHGGQNQVEGVFASTAVGRRIRERSNRLEQLEDRSWPAVGHDQRQCSWMPRADVDEVYVEAVDPSDELRLGVELRFRPTPIVARAPVGHERLQLGELNALGGVVDGFSVGPPRCRDAAAKVGELLFRNVDAEGADRLTVSRPS